jgi:hypothetical protein
MPVMRFTGAPHPPSLRRVFLFRTCTFSREKCGRRRRNMPLESAH